MSFGKCSTIIKKISISISLSYNIYTIYKRIYIYIKKFQMVSFSYHTIRIYIRFMYVFRHLCLLSALPYNVRNGKRSNLLLRPSPTTPTPFNSPSSSLLPNISYLLYESYYFVIPYPPSITPYSRTHNSFPTTPCHHPSRKMCTIF